MWLSTSRDHNTAPFSPDLPTVHDRPGAIAHRFTAESTASADLPIASAAGLRGHVCGAWYPRPRAAAVARYGLWPRAPRTRPGVAPQIESEIPALGLADQEVAERLHPRHRLQF